MLCHPQLLCGVPGSSPSCTMAAILHALSCTAFAEHTWMLDIVHQGCNVACKALQAADKAAGDEAAAVQRAVHGVQDIRCMRPTPTSHCTQRCSRAACGD